MKIFFDPVMHLPISRRQFQSGIDMIHLMFEIMDEMELNTRVWGKAIKS